MASHEAGGTAYLAALQLADSSLPVGRLVHSHGLEAWFATNLGCDAPDIEELVRNVIIEAIAPLDGVLTAHAHRAESGAVLLELDAVATAHKPTLPARGASHSCGRRLARVATELVDPPPALAELLGAVKEGRTPGNLAVVEGAVARAAGISCRGAVLIELRGAAGALLSAAVRLGRLRAMRAQAMLTALAPTVAAAAEAALGASLADLRSNAGELELAALVHGRMEGRLFAT